MTESDQDFIINNISACEYIDDTISTLYDFKNSSHVILQNASSVSFSFGIIALSIITLTLGAKLFRVVAGILFALLTFFAVYEIINTSDEISCTTRIGIASVLALIAAFITGCVIKFALFVVGSVCGAGVIHITFISLPIINEKLEEFEIPEILGKSVVYWGLVITSALALGLWMRCYVKSALEVTTSILGGCAFSYGLYGLQKTWDINIPFVILIPISAISALFGIIFQRKTRKGCRKKNKMKEVEVSKV